MTIDKLDSSKILISLCRDDISELSLSLSGGVSDRHTERLLLRIVRFACSKTGIQAQDRPLLIEALEHKNGCLLLVTLTAERKDRAIYRIKKKKDCFLYIFDDPDAFLSAYEYLRARRRILRHCKIISLSERRHIIASLGFSFPEKIDRFLCEYGRKKRKDPLILAIISEKNS